MIQNTPKILTFTKLFINTIICLDLFINNERFLSTWIVFNLSPNLLLQTSPPAEIFIASIYKGQIQYLFHWQWCSCICILWLDWSSILLSLDKLDHILCKSSRDFLWQRKQIWHLHPGFKLKDTFLQRIHRYQGLRQA